MIKEMNIKSFDEIKFVNLHTNTKEGISLLLKNNKYRLDKGISYVDNKFNDNDILDIISSDSRFYIMDDLGIGDKTDRTIYSLHRTYKTLNELYEIINLSSIHNHYMIFHSIMKLVNNNNHYECIYRIIDPKADDCNILRKIKLRNILSN